MVRRILCALGVALAATLALAAPAAATLSPQCTASAVLTDGGTTYQANAADTGTVDIPRKASVKYQGSIDLPAGRDYAYRGEAKLKVLFTEMSLSTWSWDGDTDKVATTGDTSYDLDLPAGFLGGVKGTVTGSHTQGGLTCTGNVNVKIDGSAVNPASVGSAVAAAAGAAGLTLTARGKR